MQIMIGCERLQAMKWFLILYFPRFFFFQLVYIQLIVLGAITHVSGLHLLYPKAAF